jgi:hypothetical protein
MARSNYFAPGDHNALCSMCGRKRKASELVKNWQGAYRCPEHNEPRHPQDFAKGIQEHPGVAWSQAPNDVFVVFCTAQGSSSIPNWATPGCAIPSRLFNLSKWNGA